jgi:hypothetical protein
VTLTYTLRFRDLWRFNAVHQLRSVAVQFLYIGLALLFTYSTVSVSKCSGGFCALTAVVAFVLVYVVAFGIQLGFNAVFLFSRNNKNVLTQHRVEVTSEGLYEETTYSKCLFLWPGIHKIVHAAGITAVYVTAHSAILVPDQIFASSTDRDEFLRKIKEGANAI